MANTLSNFGSNIVNIASREIGTKETGNNINKYGAALGLNGVAWCCLFVLWCAQQAGINGKDLGLNACSSTFLDRSNIRLSDAKPGDIFVFKWNNSSYRCDHVGIFNYKSGNEYHTIEGNVSDCVKACTRYASNIVGVVRLQNLTGAKITNNSAQGIMTATSGGAISESTATKTYKVKTEVTYQTSTRQVEQDDILNADIRGMNRTKSTSLLSYPSLVEMPFIKVKIGNYTFGSYTRELYKNSTAYKVDYPNYMTSLDIVKVNGTVNTYTLVMTYLIRDGDDPNLLDKIFSSVGYGKIYLTYGDLASPSFVYKEEEAIITQLKSNIDFQSSRITYTLLCTSNALTLRSSVSNYPAYTNKKPSDIIFSLLYSQGELLNIFTGMKNKLKVITSNLIPTNDKPVNIPAKNSTDLLSYINYLVTYMSANTNVTDDAIRDSSYYMTIADDTMNDFGGPYFKITQVTSNSKTLASVDTYEVDVGYPLLNFVTNFKIDNDLSWALLYKYADDLKQQEYVYSIDNDGILHTDYSQSLTTSSQYFITTEALKTWWTNMTKFPIKATLTIKGLIRPATLMTYVRINAFFYGLRHSSSGIYVITKQEDKVDSRGYLTILSLLRVGGDDDYIKHVKKTVVTRTPIVNTTTVIGTGKLETIKTNYTYPSGNTYCATTLGSPLHFENLTELLVLNRMYRGDSTIKLVSGPDKDNITNKGGTRDAHPHGHP